ncbi:hypothetical protein BKA62DRAFT_2538 [Auriculariales sp. MPI-PUGE-AT-0066]|nr:hypothetical protein BKA62DRAFT_2538 [Auriculariales sp. MPI-PUGE-AT-0066]
MGKPATAKSLSNAAKTGAVWWVTAWFVLTAPVIFWDAGYCLMRPRSMRGGDLHWIWKPYSLYQDVDLVYGLKALEDNNGFTSSQAFMNIVETLLNLYYVYGVHFSPNAAAPVIGLCAATMTLSKTVLYWGNEYFCSYCAVGHNNLYDLIVLWIIPNGIWLVFPTFVILRLARQITQQLSVAASVKTQ